MWQFNIYFSTEQFQEKIINMIICIPQFNLKFVIYIIKLCTTVIWPTAKIIPFSLPIVTVALAVRFTSTIWIHVTHAEEMKIHWFGKYSALSCAKFLIFAKKWVGKVYVWYGGCHVYSQHFPLPVMRWSYSHFSLLLVSRDTGTWQHWASSVTVNYGVKVSIKSWIISVILVNDHRRGKWFIHGNI